MRDVFATIAQWLVQDRECAIGTLVESYDSAPAPIGTSIVVDSAGTIVGNIGAGCYESDIVEACLATIADGAFRVLPINLTSTDEITGTAGCGGSLRVAVWRPDAAFADRASAIARGERDVIVDLPEGFAFAVAAKRPLTIVGATSLAQELARLAKRLDFFTTVVDPRPVFATRERIPDADELVLEWPDDYLSRSLSARSTLLVISHDPKFDLPALRSALETDAWYIGLLGSRRSQAARREALRELGVEESRLARIHGPAGLDLGGFTAAETALSILGQIVALSNGRSGSPIEMSLEPIHQRVGEHASST